VPELALVAALLRGFERVTFLTAVPLATEDRKQGDGPTNETIAYGAG